MKTFIVFGTYTAMALKGFISNPAQDRKAAVEKMSASIGSHLLDFRLTRGKFDFVATLTGTADQIVALKIAVLSTGAIGEMHILEEMEITDSAIMAAKALREYQPPQ
ncbi:GYD domain-containing protein [Litorivicinus sp.]|jgi:uncharacterized protein with GYD domain|nr:GYD domain-containing protein [Litorivicinus sp.]MDB9863006.1 GYD domain-containing protein [Litorivicinus sp.]MDC1240223.1 GYD domain-containing protein [Litorivicinus sp.]MDC1466198.1 GYD domain-containing protein [Litorivicinus sp.]|tara:strand:- start:707 stop:1027 length:321 start_codon:yes stop_codon:yes gene_type:complete